MQLAKQFKQVLVLGAAGLIGGLTFGTTNSQAESVNSYITRNHIGHAKVTKAIWGSFPKHKYRHGKGKPEGVVVHETGNSSSSIYGEISYMKSNYNNAFVHSFVDAGSIINIANTNYLAWGAGPAANQRYVQFEQIEVHSKSAFAHEVNNAAWYTASLLSQYGLKPNDAMYDHQGTVWDHAATSAYYHQTDHTDPVGYYASAGRRYFGQPYTMAAFYQRVKKIYTQEFRHWAKVKYYRGSNEPASLNGNYAHYGLYNHIKDSRYGVKKISWAKVKATNGKKVYLNMRGHKEGNKTWYRLRFSKSKKAKQYWVYAGALNLANVNYSTENQTGTISQQSNYALRNHVYASPYLSKKTGTTASLRGQQVKINEQGLKRDAVNGKMTTWYRINANGKNQWVAAAAFEKNSLHAN